MSCSVVMVLREPGPALLASVKSVLRQSQLAELLIVESGNPPAVLSRLQQMSLNEPRLRVISAESDVGHAAACNIGAAQATGEFLLFMSPECLLPPEALTDTMAAFYAIPEAMLAGCWLKNPDGSERRGGRRQLLTPKILFTDSFALHRLSKSCRPLDNHKALMPELAHEVAAISSDCMCMRKADFEAIGRFDEDCFMRGEDMDLCLRVHQEGKKVICVPNVQATFFHAGRGDLPSQRMEWYRAKGKVRYFNKHFRGEVLPGQMGLIHALIYARFAARVLCLTVYQALFLKQKMSHSTAAKKLMVLASGLVDLNERKDWEDKTVLVTGSEGQVGLCVIKRMLASGASVLAVTKEPPPPYQHQNLRWLQSDITDSQFRLNGYLVDVAVHCAPLWELPPIIHLLKKAEVKRVVAMGSSSVFTKALSHNAYERNTLENLRKAEMELMVECDLHGIQWTLFRPTMIYGVGLDANISAVARWIDRLGFFPVYPPAFGRRQPVHAEDLAMAAIQAISAAATVNKAYNISGGEVVGYHEMLGRIFNACKRKPWVVPTTLLPLLLDIAGKILRKPYINGEIARRMNEDLVFFHDDATQDFGYKPRAFLSGGLKDIEGF